MASKKQRPSTNIFLRKWPLVKMVLLVIFVLHFIWFVIYAFNKITNANLDISFTRKQLGVVAMSITFIAIAYFAFLKKYAWVNKCFHYIKEMAFAAYGISLIYCIYLMVFSPPITLTQMGSLIGGHGLQKDNIWYSDMGSNIKLAAIASEDQLFPDHDGFDLKAIKLAMKYNKRHPGKQRGGSTISQQTAKNVFLFQGAGYLRKGPEMFYTFTIEQLWTKRTILEHYLNVAETGRGIFGVEAASQFYFKKSAKDLSKVEAAQIIATLPNPKVYTVKPMHEKVAGRYPQILRQMNALAGDPDVAEIIK